MTRRSVYTYAALALGPLALGVATLVLRLRRSRRARPGRENGHTDPEALEQTVEEFAASG